MSHVNTGSQYSRHENIVYPQSWNFTGWAKQFTGQLRTHHISKTGTESGISIWRIFFATDGPFSRSLYQSVFVDVADQRLRRRTTRPSPLDEFLQLENIDESIIITFENETHWRTILPNPFKAHQVFISQIPVMIDKIPLDQITIFSVFRFQQALDVHGALQSSLVG